MFSDSLFDLGLSSFPDFVLPSLVKEPSELTRDTEISVIVGCGKEVDDSVVLSCLSVREDDVFVSAIVGNVGI